MMSEQNGNGRQPQTVRAKAVSVPGGSKLLSSTMEIPLGSLLEDVTVQKLATLEVAPGDGTNTSLQMEGSEMLVGRDEGCLVRLDVSEVSRTHARIFRDGEDYVVEDMDSTNGTFVNGVRISRCVLRNNDRIRIGRGTIHFVLQRIRA